MKPFSGVEFQNFLQIRHKIDEPPVRWLDRWTEVLGPSLRPAWIRLEGIPFHARSKKIFRCIGECFGQVLEVDEDFVLLRKVD